jgi:multidrug transporter EmrE-like cation transporter
MSATYLWLIASTVVFMAANSVLKVYAGGAALWVLIGALALFCLGNTLMVGVLRGEGLGVAIALSVVSQMVAVSLLAVLVFGERLAPLQWAGIALGVVAVALIAWPRGAGA